MVPRCGPYGSLINDRPVGSWELQLRITDGKYRVRAVAFASGGPSIGTGGTRVFESAPVSPEDVARGGSFEATCSTPFETRR
jgi:hypothetical protein